MIPFDQNQSTFTCTAQATDAGKRLDKFLQEQYVTYSRAFFQKLIEGGHICLNGTAATKVSTPIKAEDRIDITIPPVQTHLPKSLEAAQKPTLVYEHADFLVLNKPAGLSVHAPSPTSTQPSVVDWLLTYFQEVGTVGLHTRPGIVHRLDKDTSGLLLIARTAPAHAALSTLFKDRAVKKEYRALVHGHPPLAGTMNMPIGRDHVHPTKMRVISTGRAAITTYTVLAYFRDTALLALFPVTGRTHQLRIHCAALGHPVVGDSLYGKKSELIGRQALHAATLSFFYEGQEYTFVTNEPEDFKRAQEILQQEV